MIENNLVITTKKGKKKINLEAPLLPGRQYCQCHAQVHNLINNCLVCGRVICEQEGAGPCFFCGNDVLAKGQRAEFGQDEEAFPEFQDPNSDIQKAIQHKNKMIEFDKSNFIQKNVFDEQTDWYSIADDVWQDKKARKQAIEQLVARQEEIQENDKYIHVQYDVTQGKWIENKPIFDEQKFKQKAQEFQNQIDDFDKQRGSDDSDDDSNYTSDSEGEERGKRRKKTNKVIKASANKSLKQEQQNLYDEIKQELEIIKQSSFKVQGDSNKQNQNAESKKQADPKKNIKISSIVKTDEFLEFQKEVQSQMMKEIEQNNQQNFNGETPYDEALYNMQLDDEGKCLSMLQPWASLLVEGFKRFEGRFWTTDYKGPLYIHAGATPPTQQLIDEIESQYKEHYKGVKNMPPFPKRYPTGCLIGCVDLQGVLTKDEYIANIPEKYREDSQCDHIFVVRNPRKLFYPIKLKGSKNIFDIPNDIRINSKNQLIKVPSTWYEWCAKDIDIDLIQGKYDQQEEGQEEQKQLSENEKFNMNYPTLGDKQGSQQNRKASEEIPAIQKKRSNQKKDFMQSAEIHNKLRGFASEIKVKMEGFGFMLAPFLDLQEQTQIADYFLQKSGGSYKIGITNVDSFQVDNTFPFLEKIQEFVIKSFCYFTEGKKSDCMNQLKQIEYFYLNQKQKRFAYNQEYFLILMLGCDYEIVVQNNQTYKTKQVKVANATVLMQLYDEHTSIIYESVDLNTKKQAKDINLKDTITNLVICFKSK
ncbi:zinc finger, C2HC5-type family protein (macronuclear) [Tetrahymena thermophila SB210]|uniref:Zinc finger, C2HC5-type family protein n=1 Tax=Tetrahymena thermophila (strain SB210) TaxID=312017 RepID=I7MIB0_TETTS|nr:zinc finger, C2HC5-type family protein [Tetrahymena thermophila SB210]EAR92830.2 zinc finger, C2HC5-type family protein [Tetrahymena thermophila SB210]|eukprot:XP_001013075.2 zinc finger, C2HC5-type family protein [Tetrahymena thermophila SB210]